MEKSELESMKTELRNKLHRDIPNENSDLDVSDYCEPEELLNRKDNFRTLKSGFP